MDKKKIARSIVGISIGAVLYGMGYAWFLIPFKIAPGGLGGISQIFYHFFNIPAGLFMLVLNIPLFILGVKVIGKQFGIGTLYGIVSGAFFTDFLSIHNLYKIEFLKNILEKYNHGKPIADWAMTDNSLLAAIAGSTLLGAGIGLIFKFRGSTGGTDIPVAILKKYFNTSMTTGYLIIETGIVFVVGIIFKDPNLIIWGFFTIFVTSKICDLVLEGLPYVKGVYIISTKPDEIKQEIFNELERGVTVFHGEGGYEGEPKKILLCAINQRQISSMRDIVKKIDPEAFVIMHDINDVLGYGFKSRHIDMSDQKAK